MKQPLLVSPKPARERNRNAYHAAANLEAARIITAQPERYQGLVLEWAHLVLRRHGLQQRAGNDTTLSPITPQYPHESAETRERRKGEKQ